VSSAFPFQKYVDFPILTAKELAGQDVIFWSRLATFLNEFPVELMKGFDPMYLFY